jgi:mannose-6-phosphate isomerase-like protein (cupin superfamily)
MAGGTELRQGKNWGYTTAFFETSTASAHHLSIRKGGYCSKHRHDHKFNLFYVLSGLLELTIWRENDVLDITVIEPGQVSGVPPGFWHRFKALEPTEAVEVYEVLLIEPDIEREPGSQGGIER